MAARPAPTTVTSTQAGYDGDNPWHDWANAGARARTAADGWAMRHARKAARVPEEDSETPYMTRRAMDFIEAGRRQALVPAPLLHQAALALHRAGALQRHVRAEDVLPVDRARRRSAPTRIRSSPPSWTCA